MRNKKDAIILLLWPDNNYEPRRYQYERNKCWQSSSSTRVFHFVATDEPPPCELIAGGKISFLLTVGYQTEQERSDIKI